MRSLGRLTQAVTFKESLFGVHATSMAYSLVYSIIHNAAADIVRRQVSTTPIETTAITFHHQLR